MRAWSIVGGFFALAALPAGIRPAIADEGSAVLARGGAAWQPPTDFDHADPVLGLRRVQRFSTQGRVLAPLWQIGSLDRFVGTDPDEPGGDPFDHTARFALGVQAQYRFLALSFVQDDPVRLPVATPVTISAHERPLRWFHRLGAGPLVRWTLSERWVVEGQALLGQEIESRDRDSRRAVALGGLGLSWRPRAAHRVSLGLEQSEVLGRARLLPAWRWTWAFGEGGLSLGFPGRSFFTCPLTGTLDATAFVEFVGETLKAEAVGANFQDRVWTLESARTIAGLGPTWKPSPRASLGLELGWTLRSRLTWRSGGRRLNDGALDGAPVLRLTATVEF